MAQLLILTSAVEGDVLPSLALLSHRVRSIPAEPASLINAPATDLIFVDARHDLASAKSLCKILTTTGLNVPLVLVLTEGNGVRQILKQGDVVPIRSIIVGVVDAVETT